MKPIKPCDKCKKATVLWTSDIKLCKECREGKGNE